jgi:hypothetical protein
MVTGFGNVNKNNLLRTLFCSLRGPGAPSKGHRPMCTLERSPFQGLLRPRVCVALESVIIFLTQNSFVSWSRVVASRSLPESVGRSYWGLVFANMFVNVVRDCFVNDLFMNNVRVSPRIPVVVAAAAPAAVATLSGRVGSSSSGTTPLPDFSRAAPRTSWNAPGLLPDASRFFPAPDSARPLLIPNSSRH